MNINKTEFLQTASFSSLSLNSSLTDKISSMPCYLFTFYTKENSLWGLLRHNRSTGNSCSKCLIWTKSDQTVQKPLWPISWQQARPLIYN